MENISQVVEASESTRSLTLVDRSAILKQTPEDAQIAFFSKYLLQCTLPHSKPKDQDVFVRRNGTFTLVIQPGWSVESGTSLGVPYGSIPRLVLAWMITEAIQRKNRRINLGSNLADFLRALGYDSRSRGPRCDAKRVRRSIDQLMGAKISVKTSERVDEYLCERTNHMLVAPKSELWWDVKDPSQALLWGSWIELSQEFFEFITKSPIPCDMRALQMLKGSPLALDLYMLANFTGANYKKPYTFKWTQLSEQLGLEYAESRNVRTKIKAAMVKVCMAHPDLKISYSTSPGNAGLTIHPSIPAIPRVKAT